MTNAPVYTPPEIHSVVRDPGYWAARMLGLAVARNERLETEILAEMQGEGLSKARAEEVLGEIYDLGNASICPASYVAHPTTVARIEQAAVDLYGDDDVRVDGGRLVATAGEDGFWVAASLFVPVDAVDTPESDSLPTAK